MLSLLTFLFVAANGDKYVKTPHGPRLSKCVHHAPSGSIITPYDDYTEIYHPKTESRKHYPRDQDCINDINQLFPPSNTGFQNLQTWVDFAFYPLPNPDNMGNFTSIYQVPSAVKNYYIIINIHRFCLKARIYTIKPE